MLEEDLLAGRAVQLVLRVKPCVGPEVHREKSAVEGQAAQRHAVDRLVLGDLDGRGVFDNPGRIVHRLVGIIELDAPDLGGGLDRDEGVEGIRDDEQGAGRLSVRDRAAAGRAVDTDEGNVLLQDDAALDGIAALDRLDIERHAAAGRPVDGGLEADPVDRRLVGGEDVERLDGVGHRLVAVFRLDGHFDDLIDGVLDGLPYDLGAGHQRDEHQQQGGLCFHGYGCVCLFNRLTKRYDNLERILQR